MLSEAYYDMVKGRDDMEIESGLFDLEFDENGTLLN